MKSLTVVLSILCITAFAACSHFSIRDTPLAHSNDYTSNNPPELNAFLEAATEAAKQLALAEKVSEWRTEYDKVAKLREQLPEETLNKAQQKECDSIVEQMEVGKLAIEMKRVDAKTGLKQCKIVSTDILKHVKTIKSIDPKAKA